MVASKEDFDLYSLIIQIINSMQSGSSANLYSYIIDALTQSSVKQNNQQSNLDLSWLDEYIQKTVRESIDNQHQDYSYQDDGSTIADSNIKELPEANQIQNKETAVHQEKDVPSSMERIIVDIQPQIIDTNDNFIVRIKIAETDDESKLNVHIYRDHLTVKVGSRLLEHIIPVPESINAEHAAASVKNHILEIRIPKEQDENPRHISIDKD